MRMPRLFAAGLLLTLMLAAVMPAAAQDPGTRAFASSQFTVTTTAAITAIARANRVAVTIQTLGATAIYCGPDNTVTSANGFRIPATDGASVTIPTRAAVWCITAAGSQAVGVLESF